MNSFNTLIISSELTGVKKKLCILGSGKKNLKSSSLQLFILLSKLEPMSLKKELNSLAICLESTIFTLKLSGSCLNFFLTLSKLFSTFHVFFVSEQFFNRFE